MLSWGRSRDGDVGLEGTIAHQSNGTFQFEENVAMEENEADMRTDGNGAISNSDIIYFPGSAYEQGTLFKKPERA